jgi:hypothetical protein
MAARCLRDGSIHVSGFQRNISEIQVADLGGERRHDVSSFRMQIGVKIKLNFRIAIAERHAAGGWGGGEIRTTMANDNEVEIARSAST